MHILINVLIVAAVSILTYGLTVHFDHNNAPNVIVGPADTISAAQNADGETVPEFSFEVLDGKTHNITDFKDKIVILNFWASWCAPCVKEFPTLLEVAKENADDTVLIAISSDHDQKAMQRFLKKLEGNSFMSQENVFIAMDKDTRITAGIFQTYRLPETIIIDKNQVLRAKLIGADWEKEDMEKIISRL